VSQNSELLEDKENEKITPNVCRYDCYCSSGCLCVCRSVRFAGRASTSTDPNINLNQHYDDDNPYDSQFDSLRTLSGFLH
jgi:hypothetical protein